MLSVGAYAGGSDLQALTNCRLPIDGFGTGDTGAHGARVDGSNVTVATASPGIGSSAAEQEPSHDAPASSVPTASSREQTDALAVTFDGSSHSAGAHSQGSHLSSALNPSSSKYPSHKSSALNASHRLNSPAPSMRINISFVRSGSGSSGGRSIE